MEETSYFPPELLEVKTARGKKFIFTDDIVYIKAASKHCFITFVSPDPPLETHSMLKWFEEQLSEPQYCRCHDSYILNFRHCDCFNGNNFVLKDNGFIPISVKRKAHSLDMLREYLLKNKRRTVA